MNEHFLQMGARPEDYEMSSPQKSYIHVDEFKDAKELAEYLNLLDRNDGNYHLTNFYK